MEQTRRQRRDASAWRALVSGIRAERRERLAVLRTAWHRCGQLLSLALPIELTAKDSQAPATCDGDYVDPYTYLVDVLQRVGEHPASRVAQLTPRLWKALFADKPLRSDLHSFRS